MFVEEIDVVQSLQKSYDADLRRTAEVSCVTLSELEHVDWCCQAFTQTLQKWFT